MRRMQLYCSSGLCLFLLSASGLSNAAHKDPAIQTSVRLETKRVLKSKRLGIMAAVENGTADNSLVLKWRLKNVSKEGVRLRDTNLLIDYVTEIVDEEGKPARLTPKGEKMLMSSRMLSHRSSVSLAPGEEMKKQIDIMELYDLRRGPVYAVTVERRIGTVDGKAIEVVRSNTIKYKLGS
jgi:hypothetical protein